MIFEFSAQKLVYGGEALGHFQGHAVLVPRALPGERLEVELVRTAKGIMRARPLRILEPVPERVSPPCPYFGGCGGCHYQHLSPEKQAAWKTKILRETLQRIGRVNWEGEIPIHAGPALNYRNQAQLKVEPAPSGQARLGFYEAGSHRLFPIEACLILSPRLNSVLRELQRPEWSRRLSRRSEITMYADDRDEKVMLVFRGTIEREESERLGRDLLDSDLSVRTVAFLSDGRPQVLGEPALLYQAGEFRYQISPGSFFQGSRFLLPELVDTVIGGLAGETALDLYAGVGLFTLPLARRFSQVIGVEAHSGAARDLTFNAQAHHLANVRPVAQTAFDFLRRFAHVGPDVAIIDPPRAGATVATLRLLLASRPKRIIYLSCCPPTLARDLAWLVQHGYALESVELFDLFPQTYHIECLVKLTSRVPARSCAAP